jgi:Uma2 family endonuclease
MSVMDKVQELIEAPLSAAELVVRYQDLCDNRCFANVPGKIEIDVWGRLVMTPPSYYHGLVQGRLCRSLAALGGETGVETAIATATGLFVADVTWASDQFVRAHLGEIALQQAPEVCIEVVSPSNSRNELEGKTAAFLAAGAREVWIVYLKSKRCEFYGPQGLMDRSNFAVDLSELFKQ